MITEFDEYFDKNPRESIHNSMKGFLEYAKKKYNNLPCVNMDYSESTEEQEEEVENYIGESMEALLLYKEYLETLK